MTDIFIDGAAGTTGLEIHERLADREDVRLIQLPEARRKDAAARAEALNAADIAILCLPDDAAREAVTLIENDRTRIIDASTAHRTAPGWVYGFPELEPGGRAAVGNARRVSNPGCYPTGFLALVRPLVREGLLKQDALLSVNAVSGYSGGGKGLISRFEDQEDPDHTQTAFRAYGLGLGHKHVSEMRTHSGLDHAPIFFPAVVNAYRGMIVEVPIHLSQVGGSVTALRDCLAAAYEGAPTVTVNADPPAELFVERQAGTDRLELFVFGEDRHGQARLIAALDNLGKGAAGAAVQSLNLMAGLAEDAGLRL